MISTELSCSSTLEPERRNYTVVAVQLGVRRLLCRADASSGYILGRKAGR
jgi:hypothetical protein